MNRTYSVLSTIATSGQDISLVNGQLVLTGVPNNIRFSKLQPVTGGLRATVAEVKAVVTIGWTAGNATTYAFTLNQILANDNSISNKIRYVSDASGTDAEIGAGLKAIVDALPYETTSVTVSGATLVITALAGSPLMTGALLTNTTYTLTTAGVQAFNTYASLTAQSLGTNIGTTTLTSGKTYSSLQCNFSYVVPPSFDAVSKEITQQHTVYVQDDATNYAAYATRAAEVLGDLQYGATTADPEGIAVA